MVVMIGTIGLLVSCAQKSKIARERNAARKAAAGKGSQLKAIKKAQSIQCKVCFQTFMCTSSQASLQAHIDAKHSKLNKTFAGCFPDYEAAAASSTASKKASKNKAKGNAKGGKKR
ncbi:uncharacterized protein AMSG_06079 [Thecamonas trahens ATCC 50062]|uniref:At2g23090-like zinc-binding domain-containing protein n=1 Tax=Thecamonas trahens ATCC 50062 TaxID=461836 RepID=A0A0L0DBT5_THETB|nr:hypothetical protein AMSG_06079 [Thecamonas trahens ATCC 50062]KNC49802.1 hypothetical protein AMSG_06079 [Thecamonas trahens ATCC 50062]|eukprot:XP_013757586.1 hypothetical protein AMSG_06079 [Thecamonas trahens ATCC 50062]